MVLREMIEYDCLTVKDKLECFSLRQIDGNVGILGEGNSNKEYLVKASMRLVNSTGHFYINGEDVLSVTSEEFKDYLWIKLSEIPSDPYTLFSELYDIKSHFVEIVMSHGLGDEHYAEELALEYVKLLGLETSVLDKYTFQLNPMEAKKVEIALASFLNPEVIFVEDIGCGLNDVQVNVILNSLLDMESVTDSSFVVLDNDPAVISRLADYTVVLYKGEIIEEGEEVLSFPLHPYTQAYLGGYLRPSLPGRGCKFSSSCPFSSFRCKEEIPKGANVGRSFVRCHLYPW
ncbi:ABC transporter ATP-binding protein [Sulfuracidifex tepidarius]|nr:ABC transporter ATP-binding protein [Sulfuracidifex tepidarius]